jgi:hypothetical protein
MRYAASNPIIERVVPSTGTNRISAGGAANHFCRWEARKQGLYRLSEAARHFLEKPHWILAVDVPALFCFSRSFLGFSCVHVKKN